LTRSSIWRGPLPLPYAFFPRDSRHVRPPHIMACSSLRLPLLSPHKALDRRLSNLGPRARNCFLEPVQAPPHVMVFWANSYINPSCGPRNPPPSPVLVTKTVRALVRVRAPAGANRQMRTLRTLMLSPLGWFSLRQPSFSLTRVQASGLVFAVILSPYSTG